MLWLLSRLWKWGQLLAVTLISAVVFGVMVACGDWLFSIYLPTLLTEERLQYLSNLFSEFFGIVMTIVIVDRLNAHRQQRELEEELLVQVKGRSNEFALYALDRLRYEKRLTGMFGLLRGQNLAKVNWASADLTHANLRGAVLTGANLKGANLAGAKVDQQALRLAIMNEDTILPNGQAYNPRDPFNQVMSKMAHKHA